LYELFAFIIPILSLAMRGSVAEVLSSSSLRRSSLHGGRIYVVRWAVLADRQIRRSRVDSIARRCSLSGLESKSRQTRTRRLLRDG
jgi:hypothetical protein